MMYTLSKALGICDLGIYKTITMDFTQSSNRGKWNMVDAIINGGTNFVIMLGGIICEQTGIVGMLWIIAIVKSINLIPNLFIYSFSKDR